MAVSIACSRSLRSAGLPMICNASVGPTSDSSACGSLRARSSELLEPRCAPRSIYCAAGRMDTWIQKSNCTPNFNSRPTSVLVGRSHAPPVAPAYRVSRPARGGR